MSDDKPEPPKPPEKPSTKTSTVPLKKETVRITLRARPETGAVPPPPSASPPAPKPPAPPPAPPAPPVAAKTQPLKPAPPAAPAPPAGAKTVPLTPAPPTGKMGGAPPVAQPTARLTPAPPAAAPASPGTRPLPKATVKLQPTQPMSGPPTGAVASAPLSTGTMTLEEDSAETGLVPFAVVVLVLALAAFTFELVSSQRLIKQDPKTGSPSIAVPPAVFETSLKALKNPDLRAPFKYEKSKAKVGQPFEVDLRYDFKSTMESVVPIKTYDQFKTEQNK